MSTHLCLREETVGEILDRWPDAARVLLRWGMACPGCAMAPFETLPEAARAYHRAPESLLGAIREALDREDAGRARATRGLAVVTSPGGACSPAP